MVVKDKRVTEYIEKQKSPQKEICKKLRRIISKNFPKFKESMKWGTPVYEDGRYYLVALKDHVNLGFSIKGLSKEEINLFEGGGKTMKYLDFDSTKGVDEKRIIKFIKLVEKRNK